MESRIRNLRNKKGKTQQALADELNISQRTVAAWEKGTRKPSYELLCQIADYFGVSTDYLLGRTEAQTEKAPDPKEGAGGDHEKLRQIIKEIVDETLKEKRTDTK